jgi:hypothetical protein
MFKKHKSSIFYQSKNIFFDMDNMFQCHSTILLCKLILLFSFAVFSFEINLSIYGIKNVNDCWVSDYCLVDFLTSSIYLRENDYYVPCNALINQHCQCGSGISIDPWTYDRTSRDRNLHVYSGSHHVLSLKTEYWLYFFESRYIATPNNEPFSVNLQSTESDVLITGRNFSFKINMESGM